MAESASGAVDYAFRLRGVSRFYLEAKPLREDLASQPRWIQQAVSYAYNKGIPWVVLTNFKSLWVFAVGEREQRFITLSADQYIADVERLWLLSRPAVESGLLEQEAAKVGATPPRVTVERRLYGQLSEWRGRLFKELHLYHADLSLATVDETVQRLFNRLMFIRSCEDRNIEEPVLEPLWRRFRDRTSKGASLWQGLRRVFREFDKWYNSELFRLHQLDQAHFNDDTLSDVIEGLYGPPGGSYGTTSP